VINLADSCAVVLLLTQINAIKQRNMKFLIIVTEMDILKLLGL